MKTINYNIILCGFMGAGKTTVGKELASILNFPFVDTDKYIENKMNSTICEIFKNYGEDHFRKLETDALFEICKNSSQVISLGGGSLLNKNNVNLLKDNGKIVMLDVPVSVVKQRLSGNKERPLINKENNIEKLYNKRLPMYKTVSSIIIDADNDVKYICKDIIEKLNINIAKE